MTFGDWLVIGIVVGWATAALLLLVDLGRRE